MNLLTNPGHKYAANFAERYMVAVVTDCGIFKVCKDCADDCWQGNERL